MTPAEDQEAKALYEEFWAIPGNELIKNPSDINRVEKAHFLMLKGFERIRLMQRARKQARPYTRPDEVESEDPEQP